jgi:hypothetical protein
MRLYDHYVISDHDQNCRMLTRVWRDPRHACVKANRAIVELRLRSTYWRPSPTLDSCQGFWGLFFYIWMRNWGNPWIISNKCYITYICWFTSRSGGRRQLLICTQATPRSPETFPTILIMFRKCRLIISKVKGGFGLQNRRQSKVNGWRDWALVEICMSDLQQQRPHSCGAQICKSTRLIRARPSCYRSRCSFQELIIRV